MEKRVPKRPEEWMAAMVEGVQHIMLSSMAIMTNEDAAQFCQDIADWSYSESERILDDWPNSQEYTKK